MSAEPRDALVERWRTFPARLSDAARGSDRHLPAGEWTPAEVVRHLIAVEREVWWVRFPSLADEGEPHWAWVEPGLETGLEDASLDAVLTRFAEVRGATSGIVAGFDEAAWSRFGVHATYGRLDAMGLLAIVTDHDEEHLAGL